MQIKKMKGKEDREMTEEAAEIFGGGFNCAQAVLSSLGPGLGLDRDLCFKIATPFGAGIGRMQETCGAVTGALMVLGLRYGRGPADPVETKEAVYEKSLSFINEFRRRHRSVRCLDLLGADMNTDEGRSTIAREDLFAAKCALYVSDAAAILADMLGEK